MGHKFYYMGTMACKCNCRDHETKIENGRYASILLYI